MRLLVSIVASFVLTSSCAFLHHAQVGDIDNRQPQKLKPFDIKVSETGINIQEAAGIAEAFASSADKGKFQEVADIIALFQMGPVTGNGVYNLKYAEPMLRYIKTECPSGRVTGLMAIRETRKYPVVSGEIVKVTGYCMQ